MISTSTINQTPLKPTEKKKIKYLYEQEAQKFMFIVLPCPIPPSAFCIREKRNYSSNNTFNKIPDIKTQSFDEK